MKKILNDFLKKEIQRLGLNSAGFILCVLAIAVMPEARPLLPVFAAVFFAVIFLALGIFAARFHQGKADIQRLSDSENLLLEQQYAAAHPMYKVAYGEIHLLHDFIVSRNKCRLLVIALSGIEKVDERFRRVGVRRVPYLTFALNTGKRISVDFSARHAKDGDPVTSWLIERLGAEKIERGLDKASIVR